MAASLFALCIGYGLLNADDRVWWRNLAFSFAAFYIIEGAAKTFTGEGGGMVVLCLQLGAVLAFMARAYFEIRERKPDENAEPPQKPRLQIFCGRGFIILGCLLVLMKLQDGEESFNQADKARSLIEQAEVGDAVAQRQLSLLYYVGSGVPADCETGYMWAIIAGSVKRPAADFARPNDPDRDIPCLSHEQAAAAHARAAQWLEAHKK